MLDVASCCHNTFKLYVFVVCIHSSALYWVGSSCPVHVLHCITLSSFTMLEEKGREEGEVREGGEL